MKAIGISSGDGIGSASTDNTVHEQRDYFSHYFSHGLHDELRFASDSNSLLSMGRTLVQRHNRCHYLWSDRKRSDNSCAAKSYSADCLLASKTIRTKRNTNDANDEEHREQRGTDGFPTAIGTASVSPTTASDDGFDNNNYSARDFANTEGMSRLMAVPLNTKYR